MSTCTYTVENGVALMLINNPPMNALSTRVINEIRECVTKALADTAVRVIVFSGEGKAFIAGADISEFTDLNKKQEGSDWLKNGQELLNLIEGADKPFIAAINGYALGGGTELALACHMRIADETAQMGLPEIKLGIIPGFGGTQRSPRLIGTGRAYELVLSGNFISGKQAAEYGLVNRSAPKGEAVNEAKKLAGAIALRGRPAIKAAMEVIRKGTATNFPDALKMERDAFGSLCETDNKREGVAAFLAKRDPVPKDS
jgi:enoyl-CoA hydratase/carnithine racemase